MNKQPFMRQFAPSPSPSRREGGQAALSRYLIHVTAFVAALIFAAAARAGQTAHVFEFDPPGSGRVSVDVAGSFNGWSKTATPMHDPDGDGVYAAKVTLSNGIYYYKFIVDGSHWFNDPTSDKALESSDGYGGKNSAVLIGPDARKLPAARPDHIAIKAVMHDPSDPAQLSVAPGGLVRLGLRVQSDDAKSVFAFVRIDRPTPSTIPSPSPSRGERGVWERVTLHRIGQQLGFDIYGGQVRIDADPVGRTGERLVASDPPAKAGSPGKIFYLFVIHDGSATVVLDAKGARLLSGDAARHPLNGTEVTPFEAPATPRFVTPIWARSAVWYQIFPERFRNGSTANDPPGTQRWQSNWWATLPGEKAGAKNFYGGAGNVWHRRYGGDIQGVIQALPYLKSLGVTAIYFNPVFEADSLHKYDTTMYRHVDDNFGFKGDNDPAALAGETDAPATWKWTKTDKLFLRFLDEAHKQGFRVILDGVFNHVGRKFFAFQDVLKHGRSSKYADWFDITDWGHGGEPGKPGGIQWKAWDGDNGWLPVFRKNAKTGLAPGPHKLIFAITRRWMAPNGDASRGIDGWRLDVPQDIPHAFWKDWRKLVKSINPDAIIVGEIWGDASPWLQGDQFDAVMNYQFAMIAQDFFVDRHTAIAPTAFLQRLTDLYNDYSLSATLVQLNLLDSHDTDRAASMFVNPDSPGYDRDNRLQDGAKYSIAKPSELARQRMRQELVSQFTFAGAPMIYYGEEAGMWGVDDPSNRQPMIWRDLLPYDDPRITFNDKLFSWYQRLIAVRDALPALRVGYFRPVLAVGVAPGARGGATQGGKATAIYARDLAGRHVYVVLNRSPEARTIVVPGAAAGRYVNWLDPSQVEIIKEPGARPRAEVIDSPRPRGLAESPAGLRVSLPAWGSAILSAAPEAENPAPPGRR